MIPESRFSRPHAVCPNPARWSAPDSESTECEVTELVAAFIRAIQPELVVETGTAFGYTAFAIGEALRRNGHGRLVTLEIDPARLAIARKRLAAGCLLLAQSGPVDLREQSSLDYVPEGTVGFAWFDSLYELRAAEFRRYRQLGVLPPGTIIGFHDWTSGLRGHYFDVRAELERLVNAGSLRMILVPTPRGAAFCEVL